MMAEDSESAASQQSLELDDQDTCGIDGDNEEENEHMQGWEREHMNARVSTRRWGFSVATRRRVTAQVM